MSSSYKPFLMKMNTASLILPLSIIIYLIICLQVIMPANSTNLTIFQGESSTFRHNHRSSTTITIPLYHNEGEFFARMEVGGIMRRLIFDTGSTLNWFKCDEQQFEDYGYHGKFLEWSDRRCPYNDDGFFEHSKTCAYNYKYLDGRKVVGVLTKERFGDPVNAVIDIGCSYKYSEDFSGVEGILGMSRGSYSFISQMFLHDDQHDIGSRIRRGFSFCIVSDMDDNRSIPTSYLRIGRAISIMSRSGAWYTLEMLSGRVPDHDKFYDIKLSGIYVGSRKIVVPDGTFNYGCVLDTAMGVTRLAQDAYDELIGIFNNLFENNGYFKGMTETGLMCYYPKLNSNEHDNKFKPPSVEVRFRDILDRDVTMVWRERQLFAPDKSIEDGRCLQILGSKSNLTTIGAFQMAYIHFDFDLAENQIRFKQSPLASSCD